MAARAFTRLLSGMSAVAVLLGALAAQDPSTLRPGFWTVAFAACLLTGAVLAVALWVTGDRWPEPGLVAALLALDACIVASVWVNQDRSGGLLNLMRLVLPVLWGAAALRRRSARVHVVVVLVAAGVLMHALAHGRLQWATLTLVSTLALVGANEVVVALRASLARVTDELRDAARRDPLTGLLNRRGLGDLAAEQPLDTILMVDVDHFKKVNDTRGHAEGDRVLHALAARLHNDLPDALVVRTGGEEFVVACACPTRAAADLVGHQVHASANAALAVWAITTSVGVAHAPAAVTDAEGLARLLSAADAALYAAKNAGRDRVVMAADDPV